jgi:hypothetical protein
MEFKRIYPHVYHLRFEKCYDLAMHFLRYQEYYESLKFCGQIFTLVDYMEWYARDHGDGVFSYTKDWAGFNVPGDVMIAVSEADLPDPNKYDAQMRALVQTVRNEEGDHRFYFIGTSGEGDPEEDETEESVLDHELGNATEIINEEYRAGMEELLDSMPRKNYDAAWKALQEMRYHPITCRDEVHAYASTGPCKELKKALPPKVCEPFEELFQEWKEEISSGK